MNHKLYFLLGLSCLMMACYPSLSTSQIDEMLKDFRKSNGIDTRTTYFDVQADKKGKTIALSGTVQENWIKKDLENFFIEEGYKVENELEILSYIGHAVTRNSVSNLRTEPRHGAELSSQYLMGQPLRILSEDNGWYHVKGYDNYFGWLDGGGLIMIDDVASAFKDAEKRKVQVNETVVYPTQTDRSREVSDLVFGNEIGWLPEGETNVILPDGSKGYVDPAIFTAKDAENSIEAIIARGYSLLGRPYLWGGTSTKAMDCSGFTRTCFMTADMILERDASLQVHGGQKIDVDDRSKWKRGDLLFFGNLREDGSERITHVAIHLGDGRLIHSSERVRIESINPTDDDYNSYRDESLLRVRRIF